MNLWDQILNYLKTKVSAESFDNWFQGSAFAGSDGETLFVSVPDRETRAWLENEYATLIRSTPFAN